MQNLRHFIAVGHYDGDSPVVEVVISPDESAAEQLFVTHFQSASDDEFHVDSISPLFKKIEAALA